VVPAYLASRQWWKDEPRLLPTSVFDGKRLIKWLAARVESVARHEVSVVAIEVDRATSRPGQPVRTGFTFDEFDQWSGDEVTARDLRRGTFLEIGLYSGKGSSVHLLKRVHPREEWSDPELPNLEPDPLRYLKRTFAPSA
jgi:hypothetical protein